MVTACHKSGAQSQHLKGELRSLIRFYDFFCLFSSPAQPGLLVESWFKMQRAMLGRKLGNWMLVAPGLYCHVYSAVLPSPLFPAPERAGYNWNLTRVFWSCFVARFVAFLCSSFSPSLMLWSRQKLSVRQSQNWAPPHFYRTLMRDERLETEEWWRQTAAAARPATTVALSPDGAKMWWTPCAETRRANKVTLYCEI